MAAQKESSNTGATPSRSAGEAPTENLPFLLINCFQNGVVPELGVFSGSLKAPFDIRNTTVWVCPKEAHAPSVLQLADDTHDLLIRHVNGTTGFYPNNNHSFKGGAADFHFGDAETRWIQSHSGKFMEAGNDTEKLQRIADKFSHTFNIAQMHASQLYDCTTGIEGLDARWSSNKPNSSPGFRQIIGRAFLCIINLIHHPPSWVHPDNIPALRLLDTTDIFTHLTMASADRFGRVYKASTCFEWCKQEITSLGLKEAPTIQRLLHMTCRDRYKMEIMAQGARPIRELLPFNKISHACLLQRAPTQLTLQLHLNIPAIDITPCQRAERSASGPTVHGVKEEAKEEMVIREADRFSTIFQSGQVSSARCMLVLQGLRTGAFNTSPIPEWVDIAAAMTPTFDSANTRFNKVQLTLVVTFRDLDEGEVEIMFVFACETHATVAWLMAPAWIPLLEMEFPMAVHTTDTQGDRHPLSQFLRAFAQPSLAAKAETARILAKSDAAKASDLKEGKATWDLTVRASFSDPLEAQKMLSERILLFTRLVKQGKQEFHTKPGEIHIARVKVFVCEQCHLLGHRRPDCLARLEIESDPSCRPNDSGSSSTQQLHANGGQSLASQGETPQTPGQSGDTTCQPEHEDRSSDSGNLLVVILAASTPSALATHTCGTGIFSAAAKTLCKALFTASGEAVSIPASDELPQSELPDSNPLTLEAGVELNHATVARPQEAAGQLRRSGRARRAPNLDPL
ncbi:uncharacterized protein UTRI_02290 [Ustilago trichophora]|uniref:Uncharacterized protein n=1 Tax=Ustilago trichophora TaxID=86804 RepID=A0A5C3E8U4_9BASI|nr:uncharacterized protein UTRI_02290 [Ustilago trichophora]